ncbi:putative FCP1 isogenyy domain-containing protein C1271.03c family [Sesbania bispinosa]|nr:putative FCP1 isogenyy domain-containing protein C1271.03c family [Sesbania bispinosa]
MQISSVGTPNGCLKKRLLVLDVNGLLADIVSSPPKDQKADATIRRKASKVTTL